MPHESVIIPLQVGIVAILLAVSAVAWRHRARPGGRPFVGLVVALTLLSVIPLFMPSHDHWLASSLSTLFNWVAVLWVLFVLDYAGYDRFLNRYTVAGISIGPALTTVLVWSPNAETLVRNPVIALLAFGWLLGLLAVGILLLLKFVLSTDRLYTDQSLALVVGVAAPFLATAASISNVHPLGVNPFLPSFGVLGLAFGFALFRFELFSVLPVSKQIGRRAVVGDIQEGVVITDTSGQIVDVNPAGVTLLAASRSDLIGESVRDVFGEQASDEPDGVAPAEYRTDDGRVYEVTVSQIHDRAARPVGQAVVFRDVTDRELRETQLEVLNRVLRHNLRNKLSAVQGHAELLADRDTEDAAEVLERHMAATGELMELGERAREFERLKTRDQVTPQPVDLATTLNTLVEGVTEAFPTADVAMEISAERTVDTYPDALEIALENLLRNAAEHTDQDRPHIEITVADTDDAVEISVGDEGPGIPEHELAVLEADAESALEHGSGLGLWITKWAVQYLGGDLTFETNTPTGTTATVRIPTASSGPNNTSPEPSASN